MPHFFKKVFLPHFFKKVFLPHFFKKAFLPHFFKKVFDGGVVRFNNVVPKTKFNAPGGLGTDRFDMNKKAAEYLKKTYPDIVTIFHRKNGMTEVKLARLPRIE